MNSTAARNWINFIIVVGLTSAEGTLSILVPPYLRHLGFDFGTIGVLVAILGIMALISRLPCGMLYRPRRGKAMMVWSLLALVLTSLLYPLAPDALSFGVVRGLNGLAIGFATTTNLAMFMDAIPTGASKPRAMGFYAGALSAGYMIGNFSGGLVADLTSYQVAYWLAALYGLVALGLVFLERPAPHADPSPQREQAFDTRHVESRLASALKPMRAFSEPRVAVLTLVAFVLNFLHQVGASFFPLFGVAVGLSLTEIGTIKGVHALTNTIARPIAGPPVSRFGHRRVSYVGLAVLGALFALIPVFNGFLPFAGLFVAIGLVRALVLVANTVGIADLDNTRISRGLASGLYNGSKDLGNLASPVICGLVASLVGLSAMFVAVPLLSTLAFFGAVYPLRRRLDAHRRAAEAERVG